MGATVYVQGRDGVLTPLGYSREHEGADAILAVLLDKGLERGKTSYVAYADHEGREIEVYP